MRWWSVKNLKTKQAVAKLNADRKRMTDFKTVFKTVFKTLFKTVCTVAIDMDLLRIVEIRVSFRDEAFYFERRN